MKPRSAFSSIEWLETVDSTNSEAKRRLEALDNLSVLAAVEQTAGRGRGSHSWISSPGENLTFTLILRFVEGGISPLPSSEAVRITHFCTLAVCDYLEAQGLQTRIKWPNDIWIANRKICGILIENTFSGDYLKDSIVGIGLNLNQTAFDPALPNPVSLRLLTGREYSPASALDELYKAICRRAEQLSGADGRSALELEFSKRMFVIDKGLQAGIDAAIEDFEAKR